MRTYLPGARPLSYILALAVFALTVATQAPEARADEKQDESEDYNFSWLDPDKKVYVLQNRRYRKAMRPHLYVGGGLNLSNPFKTGYVGTGRAGFWLSEQFGIEGFGAFFANSDSDTLVAIRQRSTVQPFVREIKTYFGGAFDWAPFYAKMNIFNNIVYFDWLFNVGAGVVNTENDRNTASSAAAARVSESHFGIFFGTAMNFFLSKHFLVRLDLTGVNYGATGASGADKRFMSFDFTAGAGFIF